MSTMFFGCVVEPRTYRLSLSFDARRSGDERPNPGKGAGNAIDTRLGSGEVRLRELPINDANSELFDFAIE
jgi:hypothetical protein